MSSIYPPSGGSGMLCQRCHIPLFPNEATCRNCGYYNVPTYGNNPATQGPPSVNGPWAEGTAQPPLGQNQRPSGPPSWGQFPVSPPSTPSPQEQSSVNSPSSAPQQSERRNFFGVPVTPSFSAAEGNGHASNEVAPSSLPVTPPSIALQQPSSQRATRVTDAQTPGGPVSQVPGGPVSQAPYGVPPGSLQRPSGLLSSRPTGGPQAPGYGGPVSQAPYGAPSTGPVSQAPYGMPPAGFQQFGAPPVPGQPVPGAGPFDPSRMQSAAPQSFAAGMTAPPSSANGPHFVPPAKETSSTRRRKPWMIGLLVFLLFIVIGGGALVGYTVLLKQDKGTGASTAVTIGSSQNAVLFTDAFKNNANRWNVQSDPGIFSISLADGSLVLEDDVHEVLWEPLPGSKTFSDFTLSADAMLSQGDQINGYGFYIRGSSTQNSEMATYYRFELYGDGSYAVFKGSLNANGTPMSAKLADYALSTAIHKQGSINHITIVAKGSTLSLIVNGKLVKTIDDASYMSGSIAPFVSNMQNAKAGAQARFSNLTISAA